jgi:hypothetical protein
LPLTAASDEARVSTRARSSLISSSGVLDLGELAAMAAETGEGWVGVGGSSGDGGGSEYQNGMA